MTCSNAYRGSECGPKIAGGIALFAKKEIAHMVKYVPNHHKDSVWVKLSKEATHEQRDIFIGTCYISPPNRKSSRNRESEDKHKSVEKFFEEARNFSQNGGGNTARRYQRKNG